MEKIAIAFTHEGTAYKGTLNEVAGSGASKTWHLMIDDYYYGRLRLTNRGWVFDPTARNQSWAQLADYFGNQVKDKSK